MALTGAQDDAGRLVETYSSMLLRPACWACLPPRWAPGWPAAGSGCGSF